MSRHHGQQVLRPIDDKATYDEVKVDPPMPFWNPTQGRRDGLHNKRPNSSSDLADRQHEGPARHIRGFVRRGKVKGQMLAPGKCTPRLLVRLHQLKPAHCGDRTRRSVTQPALSERKRIQQRRCLTDNISEDLACLRARLAR